MTLDGGNVKARVSLANEIEREPQPRRTVRRRLSWKNCWQSSPGNLSRFSLTWHRLAAERGDAATLRQAWLGSLKRSRKIGLQKHGRALTLLGQQGGAVQAVFLRNLLVRYAAYRQSLDAVRTPAIFIAEPFIRFVKLPSPDSKPSEPDSALAFTVGDSGGGPALWASALALDDSGQMRIIEADAKAIKIRDGARLDFAGAGEPGRNSVLAADLNYDFKSDIVLANAAGIRIYLQQTPAAFEDITLRSKIPADVLRGKYTGAWALDIDLDGDLDIILGVEHGEPIVLRNNGDSTFAVFRPFAGINGLLALASADLDGDGTADIAMLDAAGQLHVLMNQRFGVYRERALPDGVKSGATLLRWHREM